VKREEASHASQPSARAYRCVAQRGFGGIWRNAEEYGGAGLESKEKMCAWRGVCERCSETITGNHTGGPNRYSSSRNTTLWRRMLRVELSATTDELNIIEFNVQPETEYGAGRKRARRKQGVRW